MGSHKPVRVSATPPATQPAPEWAPTNGPKTTPGPSFLTLLPGQGDIVQSVTTWSTHYIPQGPPPMKIGLGSRAQLQASLSLRVLRFAAPSLGLSGITKAKVRHRSPYWSSYKWDADESLKGKKESESSQCDLDKCAVATSIEKLLTQTLRTLPGRHKTSSD